MPTTRFRLPSGRVVTWTDNSNGGEFDIEGTDATIDAADAIAMGDVARAILDYRKPTPAEYFEQLGHLFPDKPPRKG